MHITVPIKAGSQTHTWLIKGIERYGDNYRHKFQNNYYTVVGAKPAERGVFDLVLESII